MKWSSPWVNRANGQPTAKPLMAIVEKREIAPYGSKGNAELRTFVQRGERWVLASVAYLPAKEAGELDVAIAAGALMRTGAGTHNREWLSENGWRSNSSELKNYFKDRKDYLRYMARVSAHPAIIRKRLAAIGEKTAVVENLVRKPRP